MRLLGQVEEENDIVRQQEKTLKSEMTLLRSKLANCETELLVCKNKIRLLMEEVELEQKMLSRDLEEKRRAERGILKEVDRLQSEVERAKQETEMAAQVGDGLRKEVIIYTYIYIFFNVYKHLMCLFNGEIIKLFLI